MLQTILLISALSSSSGADQGAKFALTESTRSDTIKTVTQQNSGSMTEESTSFQSQWKFQATIPFTAAEWSQLGQDASVSVKVGKQLIEEKISTSDGFNPKSNSFSFKLTRPVVGSSVYKYLTLPTDMPAAPAPAAGTRVIYGQGSLEFKDGFLKITFSTTGKSGPAFAGENFVAVEDGSFEGKLPIELTAGTQHQESELKITGTAKHRDTLKDDPIGTTVVGRTVQLSLTGKA
jgi:hypothetical protein